MGQGMYKRKELWAPMLVTTGELRLKVMGWFGAGLQHCRGQHPLLCRQARPWAVGKGRGLCELLFP